MRAPGPAGNPKALGVAWTVCLALLPAVPGSASDPGLVAGLHGATLGAGGATGAERRASGGNPAAIAPSRRGFLLHAHRPFGLGDLLVAEAGASWDRERWGWGAAWRQTGAESLFLAHVLEVQGAHRLPALPGFLPGSLDLGSSVSAMRRGIAGREPAWDFRHGHGAVWRPAPALAIGAFARGLILPVRAKDGPFGGEADPIRQIGLEARAPRAAGRAAQSFRFDLRKNGSGEWRALAALSLSPHPGFEASAGLSSAPFRFSLGMRLAWGGFAAWQAFRHHGTLGPTWLSSLGWEGGPGD